MQNFGGSVNDGILADLVGYSGLTTAAKDIADGTFMDKHGDKVDLLPETEQLIIEMAMPEPINTLGNINSVVTIHDFVSAFKKWKESTSTSPSGRHLGHYKAIVNDLEKKYRDLDLTELFLKVTNIPLQYGFAPEQWCKSITVMIEKDPGNPQIEHHWVIHLFEADYNFCLKLLWGCRMVHRGEDAKVFGDQQDGSRPGRQAIDTVHKKTLSYDISQIHHSSLAMFDNDASGCYDRIVMSLSRIAAHRLGMRCKVTTMQATALALMTYFIKTMHGISDASYRSSKLYRLFGTGQGSGGSPSIWLSTVVVLLQTLLVMAHMAMSFADPWGDIMHECNADSYVNDTSTSITDATMDGPLPLPDMFVNMQDVAHVAQKWERILYSSGGALELPKCFWYLIYWEWVNGRLQMMPNLSTPGIIALTQGQVPNYTVIKRLEVWQAMRMLGIRAAPDGNYRKEAGFLQNKANTYASQLITSNLTEMDTFIFHQSTYTPSMAYLIALTMLTVTQLNKIQCQAIQAILNKLGVNQNFPPHVTFGQKTCVVWHSWT